ncbi:GNAT family N-acetyltransferase [Streptomyces avidinii]|uniref:GNAT family N-acetyltransferase n=1 Tax=Streptomyces avidinii TaxID=1895 RepID=UPI00379127D4
MRTDLEIHWEIPPTSPGPLGRLERFMGPGKSRSESVVEIVGAGGCAVLLAAGVWSSGIHRDWSGAQWAVVVLIGLDLLGGILTNATNSAKRWYHRQAPGARRARLLFVGAHVLHLAAMGLVVLGGDRGWTLVNTALLLSAAVVVEFTPVGGSSARRPWPSIPPPSWSTCSGCPCLPPSPGSRPSSSSSSWCATSCPRRPWNGGAMSESGAGHPAHDTAPSAARCAPVLAAAFVREPAMTWISGGSDRARRAWFAATLRTHATLRGARRHLLAGPDGRPVAAALLTPPAAVPSGAARAAWAGRTLAGCGPRALGRTLRYLHGTEAEAPAGAWTLEFIGVVPEAAGRGAGGRLLDHLLAETPAPGGIFLTTADASNVGLYHRFGFTTLRRLAVGPLEVAAMWWPGRR